MFLCCYLQQANPSTMRHNKIQPDISSKHVCSCVATCNRLILQWCTTIKYSLIYPANRYVLVLPLAADRLFHSTIHTLQGRFYSIGEGNISIVPPKKYIPKAFIFMILGYSIDDLVTKIQLTHIVDFFKVWPRWEFKMYLRSPRSWPNKHPIFSNDRWEDRRNKNTIGNYY